MYQWYERTQVCFVHLKDVSDISTFTQSEWFKRGWTLQELIAPENVEFYDRSWRYLGAKKDLVEEIEKATHIHLGVLMRVIEPRAFSIAQRMSWTAHRTTSRLEDQAYCLLGLFGVNMPLLYGEGSRAFRRLQEEILAGTEDTSLFLGGMGPPSADGIDANWSVLATSPWSFRNCGGVSRSSLPNAIVFEINRRGLNILIHRTHKPDVVRKLIEFQSWALDNLHRYESASDCLAHA